MLSSHRERLSPKLGTLSLYRQMLSVLSERPKALREDLRALREPPPKGRAPPSALLPLAAYFTTATPGETLEATLIVLAKKPIDVRSVELGLAGRCSDVAAMPHKKAP